MTDRTTSHSPAPAFTTVVPVLVADELVPEVVGRTIYCSFFRLERHDDGFYEITVAQEVDDRFMTEAERKWND